MKNAFVDQTGVLRAWGYMESNGDQQAVEVPDDFALALGEWRLAGDSWVAYTPVVEDVVPRHVSMVQARLALLAAGKLPAVNAAIAALASPMKEAAQIEWEYRQTVERQSPLVSMLGPLIELDDAALDALFVEAAKL